MSATVVTTSPGAWAEAARIIAEGGLAVFPTDTVYGVGCDPHNSAAIEAIYRAKGREVTKALPLLIASISQVSGFVRDFPPEAQKLAGAFWPGALTIVMFRHPDLPSALGAGETIALRMPAHSDLRTMIAACGGALATTSANTSGQPDATTAQQAFDYLGEDVGIVLNGGPSPGGVPSTVVDCTTSPIRILRQGIIPAPAIVDRIGNGSW